MIRRADELPDANDDPGLRERLGAQPVAVFLDYDGTLTPIVARPELAGLDRDTRAAIRRLAGSAFVAIISGRDLADVQRMVEVDEIWYAGSHGFDVAGPDGLHIVLEDADAHLDALAAAADDVERAVATTAGAWLERKGYAFAVHHRQADDAAIPEIEAAVDHAVSAHRGLRKTGGKRVIEVRPDVAWDKGRAVWALFEQAGLRRGEVLPVFIGDDVTDEDAFTVLGDDGVGVVVATDGRPTAARYRLSDSLAVRAFLEDVAREQERRGR